MDQKIDLDGVSLAQIDNILDEIDENEKQKYIQTNRNISDDTNWDELLKAIRNGNINYIKKLITSNEVDVNAQNPENGKTLLICATIVGDINLVKVLCNFGCDVHIKDDDKNDAVEYAIKYGRYKITELLYYRQVSGELGNDLKDIATKIHEKTKEAEIIKTRSEYTLESIYHFIVEAIKNREPFGEDMLFYAWYYNMQNDQYDAEDKLNTHLWRAMMETYDSILSDTSDDKGWVWLKRYFLNSLIWYLPHPLFINNGDGDGDGDTGDEDDANNMEKVLQTTLFMELLSRVRAESKKQSDLLLKEKIDKVQKEQPNEWKQLVGYNVITEFSSNARQDSCGCLVSQYTENDLSEDKYPPKIHFNAKKHYDTNIYLNELLFTANILNDVFQADMKAITKEISIEGNIDASFCAGPVKTLERSQAKVQNDYINEAYPTSAKILDINRCSIQFQSVSAMMKYIEIFTNKINNKNARSIISVIRVKNGWSVYSTDYPQYTDIKLNVLMQSPTDTDKKIIAEIQFLLSLMSSFKKKAHKLYGVERKFELVFNFGKLRNEMSKFKDVGGKIHDVIMKLVQNNDVKYFKDLWNLSVPDSNTLVGPDLWENVWYCSLFNIIVHPSGKIHNYLCNEFNDLYYQTILDYFQLYGTRYGYHKLLQSICGQKQSQNYIHVSQYELINVFGKIFDLTNNKQSQLTKLFSSSTDKNGKTLMEAICEQGKDLGWDNYSGDENDEKEYDILLEFILNRNCGYLWESNSNYKAFWYICSTKRLKNA
eukprot:155859_1